MDDCKHNWMFVNGLTKRLRCQRCAAMTFNLNLIDKEEDEEFERIEREQAQGWRKRQMEKFEEGFGTARKDYEFNRSLVLEEVAQEFEKMTVFGDTAQSFAIFVRGMKR